MVHLRRLPRRRKVLIRRKLGCFRKRNQMIRTRGDCFMIDLMHVVVTVVLRSVYQRF